MRTMYRTLKDYPIVCGFKIEVVPTGTLVVHDAGVMHTDGYMARFDLPPIPKLVVENNPNYFEKIERKPREFTAHLVDGILFQIYPEISSGMNKVAEIITVREVLE